MVTAALPDRRRGTRDTIWVLLFSPLRPSDGLVDQPSLASMTEASQVLWKFKALLGVSDDVGHPLRPDHLLFGPAISDLRVSGSHAATFALATYMILAIYLTQPRSCITLTNRSCWERMNRQLEGDVTRRNDEFSLDEDVDIPGHAITIHERGIAKSSQVRQKELWNRVKGAKFVSQKTFLIPECFMLAQSSGCLNYIHFKKLKVAPNQMYQSLHSWLGYVAQAWIASGYQPVYAIGSVCDKFSVLSFCDDGCRMKFWVLVARSSSFVRHIAVLVVP